MDASPRYLYLPLEIVVREHDGKAVLAATAAAMGWRVIIGPKLALYQHMSELPEGVFLLKSAVPSELTQLTQMKQYGHKICSLDEEGVVTYKQFLTSGLRYNKQTLTLLDRVFFWGKTQYQSFVSIFPEFACKASVTGNPRIDFWRSYAAKTYQAITQELQQRYGQFVFLPSSFGIANNYMGQSQGVNLSATMTNDKSESLTSFLAGQAEFNTIVFKEYLSCLPDILQQFPETNFVVRPHPSEAHEIWQQLAAAHDNLHLEYEHAVTPWLLAASAILHFKSTTSIEAYILGKNVLTYMPPTPEYMHKFHLDLPLHVSKVATTRAELSGLLQQALHNQKHSSANPEFTGPVSEWIHLERNKTACRNILEQLDGLPIKTTKPLSVAKPDQLSKWQQLLQRHLVDKYSHLETKNRLLKKLIWKLQQLEYGAHKYKGSDFSHSETVVNCVTDSLPGHNKLHTTDLGQGLVLITAAGETS